MLVSVVIPTYNEEQSIKDCLESLAKQNFGDFEVIVVDDGSTDNTVTIIKSLITNHPSLITLLLQKHKGPGAARNLGVKEAGGEILVFVDADMTFDKNFLKNLIRPIDAGKIKGTFSKNEYVSNWDNVWARCWNINEGWEEGRRHPKNYPDKQKVFRAILKSEFDRVGGFTPGGYNDDWSLSGKLGYEADPAPGAIFYHSNPDTLKEIFKQSMWAGKRKYKLGIIGVIFSLIRASLPISLVTGLIKAFMKKTSRFIVFKVVYDFGLFIGISQSLVSKNWAK